MTHKYFYKTPEGFSDMMFHSNGEYLTGLWFLNSHDARKHITVAEEKDLPIFKETIKWLDIYFSGKNPDFTPNYKIENLTDFRKEVIDIMLSIPYGQTMTYGEIADLSKNYNETLTTPNVRIDINF